ncbi:MAG: hypothetical protein WD848_03945 [Dehalococcoidia bacterium]
MKSCLALLSASLRWLSKAAHRRGIERDAIDEEIRNNKFGNRGALFIATLGIGAGVFAIWQGAAWIGGILSGGTILGIASAYITGTRSRSSERRDKAEVMAGLRSPNDNRR